MQNSLGFGTLFDPDPEPKRTFHRRKRYQRRMWDRTEISASIFDEKMGNADATKALRDFAAPDVQGNHSSITRPGVEATNFKLKLALISMVQQSQFGGTPMEDPNMHISIFLEVCDTLKMNGVTTDAIRLRLFSFSLRDKARSWLHSMSVDSFTTWEQLSQVFLAKYSPPSKTANLRNQITSFYQREDETLYEAWERFKELLRLYPHHGHPKWLVV